MENSIKIVCDFGYRKILFFYSMNDLLFFVIFWSIIGFFDFLCGSLNEILLLLCYQILIFLFLFL